MKCKRVLYSDRFNKDIQNQLRIIKFDKIKSKKSNVYFVFFATESDAEYAMKACKKLHNVTIKPYLSYTSLSTTTTTTAKQISEPKIKLTTRYLPPNSSELSQLFESIDSCLNAISAVKSTFDEIYQLHRKINTKEFIPLLIEFFFLFV